MHVRPAACLIIGAALLAATCSTSGSAPDWTFAANADPSASAPSAAATPASSPSDVPLTAAAAPATAAVRIADFAFGPDTVTIAAGGTVTWTNADGDRHSVLLGGTESDRLETGATFSRSFPTAGRFSYVCGLHSSMTGTVVVSDGAAGPATADGPGPAGTTADPTPSTDPTATPTSSPDDDGDDDRDDDDDHSGPGHGGDDDHDDHDDHDDEDDEDHSGPGGGGSGPG